MYGVLVVSGIGAGVCLAVCRHKVFALPRQDVFFAMLYALVGALVGAKLLYWVTILPVLLQNAAAIFTSIQSINALFQGGFVFYGGLFGGMLGLYLYCRAYHLSFYAMIGTVLPGVALAHGIGRIGCFFAGCCYGKPCAIGLVMNHAALAPHHVRLFPVQLVEAAGNLLLAFYLTRLPAEKNSKLLAFYLLCYGAFRLILEQFRGDPERGVWLLSTSSWISLCLILAGGYLMVRERRQAL